MLADRVDRRLLVVAVDLMRAAVLAVLTAPLVTGHVNVAVVLVTMFLLGTAEVFADTTSGTLLPMVVPKADLGIGNARLMAAGMLTMNQLVGPGRRRRAVRGRDGVAVPRPGGVRRARRRARVAHGRATAAGDRATRSHIGRDIAEGFRWTWGNRAVRTLTLAIVTFNVTYGAAWSVLVLYATERLDLGADRLRPAHHGRRARRPRRHGVPTTGWSGTRAWRRSCGSA